MKKPLAPRDRFVIATFTFVIPCATALLTSLAITKFI